MNKRLTLAATTFALLLAACGQQVAQPAAPTSGEMVKLTLRAPVKPAGLKIQGVNGAVGFVKVKVKDASGNPVTFDGANVYQQGGSQDSLSIDATHNGITVLLPKGSYSFENIGKADATGSFLAYGSNASVDITTAQSVNLTLHTLTDAAHTTFSNKMSWTSVYTQDLLDLRLNVGSLEGGSVPMGDYSVTYSVTDAAAGTLQSGASQLGAHVLATGTTSTTALPVDASVTGWVADGAEHASQQTFGKSFSLPFSNTGLGSDLTPPTVSLATVSGATIYSASTLNISASDDKEMGALHVYDGTTLVGSTDSAEFGQNGVGEISGSAGNWTLSWSPSSAGTHDLTVIATDKAGNESRAMQDVSVGTDTVMSFQYGYGQGTYGWNASVDGNTVNTYGPMNYWYGNSITVPAGKKMWYKFTLPDVNIYANPASGYAKHYFLSYVYSYSYNPSTVVTSDWKGQLFTGSTSYYNEVISGTDVTNGVYPTSFRLLLDNSQGTSDETFGLYFFDQGSN